MEERKKRIEKVAEEATVKLFNNSMLHPEFKYGFILGANWADKEPCVKKHRIYDRAYKEFQNRACEWLSIYYPNLDKIGIDKFIEEFIKATE